MLYYTNVHMQVPEIHTMYTLNWSNYLSNTAKCHFTVLLKSLLMYTHMEITMLW